LPERGNLLEEKDQKKKLSNCAAGGGTVKRAKNQMKLALYVKKGNPPEGQQKLEKRVDTWTPHKTKPTRDDLHSL